MFINRFPHVTIDPFEVGGLKFWFVYVPVWFSIACWFVGAAWILWQLSTQDAVGELQLADRVEEPNRVHVTNARLAGLVWGMGCVLMFVHIVASYWLQHGWSHQAALRFTGDQSEAVVGIRVESGLYANFAFTMIWSVLAWAWMKDRSMDWRVTRSLHAFLASIVFFATVVFEQGPVRIGSVVGFSLLGLLFIRMVTKSSLQRDR
ncbi:MAG: hypothetical protein AAFV88_00060 [Planctomycetota bacterium]